MYIIETTNSTNARIDELKSIGSLISIRKFVNSVNSLFKKEKRGEVSDLTSHKRCGLVYCDVV